MDQTLCEQTPTDAGTSGKQRSPPTSPLESLPNDALLAILSAACSTVDLYAFIRASPVIYRAFSSAKRAVLVSIVARDLGPALRDGVAATLITPAKVKYRGAADYEETDRAIQRYKALPHGDGGLASAKGLPADMVVALVRANRSVQFFIDEFAESRLPELRKINPDAAGPLTANERRRLAQALLRHQFLARIECGNSLPRHAAVVHKFFGLLRPWETQQLADCHSFLCHMLSCAFPYSKKRADPARSSWVKPQSQVEKDAALCDLDALHLTLVAERARVAADPPVLAEGGAPRRMQPGWMTISARFNFLIAGPLPVQVGSDRVAEECWGLRDELYQREDAMPPLAPADDHDNAAPPFAWVDAHGGVDCQRWGRHARREVLPEGQESTTGRQRIWMRQKLERWRWLGFMFWDRARVELLKTGLPGYTTGWLTVAPPPDAECEF